MYIDRSPNKRDLSTSRPGRSFAARTMPRTIIPLVADTGRRYDKPGTIWDDLPLACIRSSAAADKAMQAHPWGAL
jgi:hypothetical protein